MLAMLNNKVENYLKGVNMPTDSGERPTITTKEAIELFIVRQAEHARQKQIRLADVAFEHGLPKGALSPATILDITRAMLDEIGPDTGLLNSDLELADRVLKARLENAVETSAVITWDSVLPILQNPIEADVALPIKAQIDAEFWQTADEGLVRLGKVLGLPSLQDPGYPAGHGNEYS